MDKIRVAVVEDHHLVRHAVLQQLEADRGIRVALELSHGERLLKVLRRVEIDVILLDLAMDSGLFDPISTLAHIRAHYPEVKIIVLSSLTYGEMMCGVLRAGVDGYVLKKDISSLKLPSVIRRVIRGESVFSGEVQDVLAVLAELQPGDDMLDEVELKFLRLASEGHTNRQIGFLLGYSEKTIRNRFTPIFRKLGAANRVEAIRKAQALGILSQVENGA